MKKVSIFFLVIFITTIGVCQTVVSKGQEVELKINNDSLVNLAWKAYQRLSFSGYKRYDCNLDAQANGFEYSAITIDSCGITLRYLDVIHGGLELSFDFSGNFIGTTYFPDKKVSEKKLIEVASLALDNFFKAAKSLDYKDVVDAQIRSWIDEVIQFTNQLNEPGCGRGSYTFHDCQDYFTIRYEERTKIFSIVEVNMGKMPEPSGPVKTNKLNFIVQDGHFFMEQEIFSGRGYDAVGRQIAPQYEGPWLVRARLKEIWGKFQNYKQELLKAKQEKAKVNKPKKKGK